MIKKILPIILLTSMFTLTPNKLENSRIINERHSTTELGEYGDSSSVTLASDRTNVLIKLSDDILDKYTVNNYPLRTDFKTYQKEKFENHNNKFLDLLTVKYDDIYISKYSSYIEFTFEKESTEKLEFTLKELVKHDFIEKIYLQDDCKPEEMLGGGKMDSGTTDSLITSLDGGEDIKVGLLEWGICDKNNANLSSSNITCRDEWYFIESKTEHATLMASILVGDDGMVPNAHLYSVQLSGNPVSEVDWLIDKGISVCNVSIGDGTGSYSSSSSYLDYAADTYGITFCCATGNDGDENGYVSNFAMANNCIAVGAGSESGVVDYTSRITPNGEVRPMVIGPDTVAVDNMTNIYYGGTSVATAICTGVVALIQQNKQDIMFNPHIIRALLMVNCSEIEGYDFLSNGFYECGGGAGRINLQSCIDNYYIRYFHNDGAKNSSLYKINMPYNFFVGQTWKMVLSYSTNVVNDAPVRTQYGLKLIDINTDVVELQRNIVNDGFEMIHWHVETYQQLSITTYQIGSKLYDETDSGYIAIKIEEPEE